MRLEKLAQVKAVAFARHVVQRFLRDRCPQVAAALAYSTLFALVPLLAVGLAIFTAFPVFESLREVLLQFVLRQFLPEIGTMVAGYLDQFVANAGKLTLFGVIGLGISAVILLSTIEQAFNRIWRVRRERNLALRLLRFWAALTLGPLLFGFGITLPGYLFAVAQLMGGDMVAGPAAVLARLAPWLAEFLGFTLLYFAVPNRPLLLRDSIVGGLAATVQFEGLKVAFAWYVRSSAAHQALYGALAAVPLLLFWIYLAWLVVLSGAEISAALADWRRRKRHAKPVAALPARPAPTAPPGPDFS